MNFTDNSLVFDPEIIRRYDINGPRYTSYPTADRFIEAFDGKAYQFWLERRDIGGVGRGIGNAQGGGPVSLYFHIPFCNTICYYCACNKIITKDHGRSAKYLKYMAKEVALQSAALDGSHDAIQLHWGGGTPTFLSHDEMRQLMAVTRDNFRLMPGGEFSIEVDPRKVDDATVVLLGELGFNRMSIGVQDFDERVQQAINRIQSEAETRQVMKAARDNGFQSISVDLIYGLPRQTVESFSVSIDRVLAMEPDRLSIYNYAHLPSLFKPQRRIAESDMPSAETRMQLLGLAIRKMIEAGYVYIGMDHFARPDDELAIAQRQGRLHRNFQGYSTYADCDMLSFGISSISKVGPCYAQNVKTLDEYYDILDQGRLPVMRGIELKADDLLRRSIIQALMCHFELSLEAVEIAHLINFREYFAPELEALKAFQDADLLSVDDKWISIKPAGRMLVRAISMVFDRYLRTEQQRARYSKVI